ncbi:MAG: hypothetical protein AAB337_00910 [Patescibacteria group bacterium]
MDLHVLLGSVAEALHLEFRDQIVIVENCKTVYRVRQDGRSLVVKIGYGELAQKEVEANWEGYINLRRIGAGGLLPNTLDLHQVRGVPCLLMEDCGVNFIDVARTAARPVECFSRLLLAMDPIYRASLSTESPVPAIRAMRDLVVEQWAGYLADLIPPNLVSRFRAAEFEMFGGMCSCFSTFEFKPDDLFLTDGGVKKVDPIRDNLGCPAIDLACFAGVCRDAYRLPGANSGYRLLHTFAVEQLPQILGGSPAHLEAAFSLGRSLQCALSARFRREPYPKQGRMFATRSAFYARRCMKLLT